MKYKICQRCGGVKSASEFREGQKYWNEWCKSCEKTPIGQIAKGF